MDTREIVGADPKMRSLDLALRRAALSDSPILIFGESGTGKELVARAVHAASARSYVLDAVRDLRPITEPPPPPRAPSSRPPPSSPESGPLERAAPHAPLPAAVFAHVREHRVSLHDMKREIERECVTRALDESNGNITRAAELLGMKRPRVSQLAKQYGLTSSAQGE